VSKARREVLRAVLIEVSPEDSVLLNIPLNVEGRLASVRPVCTPNS
jgi:hypothetical protein